MALFLGVAFWVNMPYRLVGGFGRFYLRFYLEDVGNRFPEKVSNICDTRLHDKLKDRNQNFNSSENLRSHK
jgi:hypothetical protein